MQTLEAIYSRRSIRMFLPKKVPSETIEEIIKAGMYAPSAYNEQPWQFIVITEKEILEKITKIHPHAKMCEKAPVAILVCGDARLVKTKDLWRQDCAAATQNMLLAATEKGLGAVWTGVFPKEDRIFGFKKLLNLPVEVTPFSFVVMGFPAEKKNPEDRFQESRIHKNHW